MELFEVGDKVTLILFHLDLRHKVGHSDLLYELEEVCFFREVLLSFLMAFEALASNLVAFRCIEAAAYLHHDF